MSTVRTAVYSFENGSGLVLLVTTTSVPDTAWSYIITNNKG